MSVTSPGAVFIPAISPQSNAGENLLSTCDRIAVLTDRLKFPEEHTDIKAKRTVCGVRYSFLKVESNTRISEEPYLVTITRGRLSG